MTVGRLGPLPVREGSKVEMPVEDDMAISVLNDILKELKIQNLHLSMMTNEQLTKEDIE